MTRQSPNKFIEAAIQALASGDIRQADALLEQVKEKSELPIQATAEGKSQRLLIAADELDYSQSYVLSRRAVYLVPGNHNYLNEVGLATERRARHSEAIGYFEQALTPDLQL